MTTPAREIHTIPPVYDRHSKILILGSFPSVISRKESFYYMHPRNRFWPVISQLCQEPLPKTIPEKKALLLNHNVALWDVIKSCRLTGSSDQTIQQARPNHLEPILQTAPVKAIFTNGKKAYELYEKLIFPTVSLPARPLPSTSPANAAYSLERLLEEWRIVLDDL